MSNEPVPKTSKKAKPKKAASKKMTSKKMTSKKEMFKTMSNEPVKKTDKKPVRKRALGRGLSALMEDVNPVMSAPTPVEGSTSTPQKRAQAQDEVEPKKGEDLVKGVETIAVDLLSRNPDQPRRHFDKKLLADLTRSIRDKGVLQPILVRPITTKAGAKSFQIVAGERRWLAAKAAGLAYIPVLVRKLSDREVLEVGVVENVQRADLNPIEEALAYQALIEQFDRKHGEIADAIGKSRSHVTNTLRLLGLPSIAREHLASGRISAGHARAILASPDAKGLTEIIIRDGLSVRAAEQWSKKAARAMRGAQNTAPKQPDANTAALEKDLAEHLGLAVKLNHKSPGGALSIRYKTLEQLDDLMTRLKRL